MRKKTKYIIGAGVIIILIFSILAKKGVFGNGRKAYQVQTGKVKRTGITETVIASGRIQPEKEVKISSEVSGEIIELPVKEGQHVNKGDLLARINPDLYQSAYERALAALSNAKANLNQQKVRLHQAEIDYNHNKTLYAKGVIAKTDFQKSETNYRVALAAYKSAQYQVKSAAAGVKEARDNLKRTTIYAPIAGTITRLNVEKGERVVGTKQMAGTEMMRIADLNKMEVLTDVNENDIVKVKLNDSARIEIEAFPGRKFEGVVTEIANSAETVGTNTDQVVNFKVKIAVLHQSYADLLKGKPADYSPFRPGMTATVEIITNKKPDVLAVPLSAVVMRRGKDGKEHETVFTVKNGKAVGKRVTTGIQDEENIEIVSGLSEGQTVITGPYTLLAKKLHTGDKVEIGKGKKKHGRFRKRR